MRLSSVYNLLYIYVIAYHSHPFGDCAKAKDVGQIESESSSGSDEESESDSDSSDGTIEVSCARTVKGRTVTITTKHKSNAGFNNSETEEEEIVVRGKKRVNGKKIKYKTTHTITHHSKKHKKHKRKKVEETEDEKVKRKKKPKKVVRESESESESEEEPEPKPKKVKRKPKDKVKEKYEVQETVETEREPEPELKVEKKVKVEPKVETKPEPKKEPKVEDKLKRVEFKQDKAKSEPEPEPKVEPEPTDDSGNKLVELDVKNKESTNGYQYYKSEDDGVFVPNMGYAFIKVKADNKVIYQANNPSEYPTKVVRNGVTIWQALNNVKIYLPSHMVKVFIDTGFFTPTWIEVAERLDDTVSLEHTPKELTILTLDEGGDTRENDITKYDIKLTRLRVERNVYSYTYRFKDEAKCIGVKHYNKEIWKRDEKECGTNYPTMVYLYYSMVDNYKPDIIRVYMSDKWYYEYNRPRGGQWKRNESVGKKEEPKVDPVANSQETPKENDGEVKEIDQESTSE